MISFDEALALLKQAARPLGTERISLGDAHRQVLASPVAARIDAPRFDTSAMDGYAVRDADLAALPARLAIAGRSFAGSSGIAPLSAGQCVRIFTGAPVPDGADRVVVQEIVREQEGEAIFGETPGPSRHIRARGSDFSEGETLLDAGHMLDARGLVAAAAADVAELEVWRRPRTSILSTGDELVAPGAARSSPGAIPDSVSIGVAALAEQWGAQPAAALRLRDDPAAMEAAAAGAVAASDLVIVTGGASVGERDFAKAMFQAAGLDLIFSKVAIKPGKPVWLGLSGAALVLGLPGNPTSAMVTARLFLAPLIVGLTGRDPDIALSWRTMPLGAGLEACGSRETFVRAQWSGETALPLQNQDSSAQRTLADAGLLIRRRPSAPASVAGDKVQVIDF